MGTQADLLARVEDLDDATQYDTQRRLDGVRDTSDTTRRSLVTLAGDLGIHGASAEAAHERFAELTSRVAAVAERIQQIRGAGASALAAVQIARDRYADLPGTTLTPSDRATIRQCIAPDLFGRTLPALAVELQLVQQKEAAREAEATTVLRELEARLDEVVLPEAATDDPDAPSGTARHHPTGGVQRGLPAGGDGIGRSPGGAASAGAGVAYARGDASAAVGGVGDLSAGVLGGGGIGGGGSPTGGTGSGMATGGIGAGVPISTPGGPGTGQATIGTPGHGDGSSSDGSTVGTLPGHGSSVGGGASVGSGASVGGGWGGSTAGGSTPGSSISGGGTLGGIASGLMVSGTALGAGRLGGASGATVA